jgi:hypothetical protein
MECGTSPVQFGSRTVRISNFKDEPLNLTVRTLTLMSDVFSFNRKVHNFTDDSKRLSVEVPGSAVELQNPVVWASVQERLHRAELWPRAKPAVKQFE